jgi:hypothetical protein
MLEMKVVNLNFIIHNQYILIGFHKNQGLYLTGINKNEILTQVFEWYLSHAKFN